ncbi:MAG TPA: TerC/Alx family metal homeostasis membrane protein [Granulicella sp.]|nr:TerC/Alx family metal homeostasis membrane protein [Granulicella sp.]
MSATPISHWIGFHLFTFALLAIEFLYARSRPGKVTSTAAASTVLWVAAALAFAGFLVHALGSAAATQYLAGYALEESLSVDNLFVFLLLFRLFQILPTNQPRVLFWGVLGAILMRGAFIAAGLGLLARFHWISYLFATILLIAAVRLLLPQKEKGDLTTPVWIAWITRLHPVSPRQDRFWVRENGRGMITMLFLSLLAIEITDLVFALDSIPAVLSITRHPFIAYTSNIMAVMGLRSLFFLLAHMLEKLRFLHYGLAAVLAFAALKMLAARWFEIAPLPSLAIILILLGITVALSLALPQRRPANALPPA